MTDADGRSKRSIVAGYASVLSGDVGRLLVFALFIPVLVRTVGSAGYGTYALVMATFMVLRKLLNLGLFEATKAYVSRTSGRERVRYVLTSLAIQLVVLVVALPVFLFAVTVASLDGSLAASLQLIAVALVGEQLYLFGRGVSHGCNSETVVELLVPVRSVLLAVVGIGLAVAGYGVPGVFAGFATAFLLTGVASTVRGLSLVDVFPSPPMPDPEAARTLVTFGLPSMVLVLLTAGLYKIDVFLVSYFLSATDTGLYRAALQVTEFIWAVALAMEMVMIQTTSPLWDRGRRDRVSELTAEFLTYVVVLTTLLVVGVFVLGPSFVGLYFGPEYEQSSRALRILLPGVFGFAVARVIWPVLQAGGYLRGVVLATAAATVANVVLNVLFIPRFGIVGAAAATSLSYGGMAVAHSALAYHVGLRPLSGLPAVRIGAGALVTALVLLALDPLLSPPVALVVLPPVGLAVYALCIFGSGAVSVEQVLSLLRAETGQPAE